MPYSSKKSIKKPNIRWKKPIKLQQPFLDIEKSLDQKHIYSDFKLNWILQKFLSRLMKGGNKYQIEKLIFQVCKPGHIKKIKYNFPKYFFYTFFEKLKKFRPRIELSKKKRRKGKTSALAKERMKRTTINRFLVPNSMSRRKQLRSVLAWIVDEIKITGLRKPKIEKPIIIDPSKKIRLKNPIKGRKNLIMAVKAAKKKRQLEKLQRKEKIIFQIYPLKRKIKTVLIDVFSVPEEKSLLFKKLNIFINILGIQAAVPGLRRWK